MLNLGEQDLWYGTIGNTNKMRVLAREATRLSESFRISYIASMEKRGKAIQT